MLLMFRCKEIDFTVIRNIGVLVLLKCTIIPIITF